jgi:hypothetical protein
VLAACPSVLVFVRFVCRQQSLAEASEPGSSTFRIDDLAFGASDLVLLLVALDLVYFARHLDSLEAR